MPVSHVTQNPISLQDTKIGDDLPAFVAASFPSTGHQRAARAAAILAAAFFLLWPALYNRFPLLYPDSINYLGDGSQMVHALHHWQRGHLGWMRSPIYSFGIFLLHWHRSPWPVVCAQALLTAWTLWLVVRTLLRSRQVVSYLAIVATLTLATGISWVLCWILPDILGALLYLCLYLIVFASERLARWERVGASGLVIWAANSHVTHLMLAIALCVWLWLLVPLWRSVLRPRVAALAYASVLVALAMALQVGANAYFTGSASLTGKHPPFLMARLLGDGPARRLLQQRCETLHWTICRFADKLPTDSDEFLWSGDSVMARATPAEAAAIRSEELPLLEATLHASPREQMRASLENFRTQLTYYDIEGFGNNTWAEHALPTVLPGADQPYHRSRQFHNAVASDLFSDIQDRAIPCSLLALVLLLPLCWRRRLTPLLTLSAVVLPAIVGNALLTGVLSVADSRYQVRVIWLLPLLALLMAASLLEARRRNTASVK